MPTPSIVCSNRRTEALRCAWIAILLGMALISAPRRALGLPDYPACVAACPSQCQGPAGVVLGCMSQCYEGCRRVNPDNSKPLPPAPYGAIAYGDQGAEGMSWNQTSSADADRVALNICGKYGTNCKVVNRFENTCAALAKADDERHFEAATGPTKEQAAASAIGACKSRWGKCSSDLSSCSFADRHTPPPGPRATSWGAIAFSAVDGQSGWAQAKEDRASAEKGALSVCSQRGKACVVMTAFNKQCGGLARDGKIAGTAVAADQQTALQQARQACTKNGGSRCAIQVLFCSR
jgi:Domain of unknown function (DUF4189)